VKPGSGEHVTFSFGENWLSYSRTIAEPTVLAAQRSLAELLGSSTALQDRSFLDIGCGSGLFSIAAARVGARPVLGIDVDLAGIRASRHNAERFAPDRCTFQHVSILDEPAVAALGQFDVVYAWGSLHHTGAMHRAIRLAARRVAPRGTFVLAIYNRWSGSLTLPSSAGWLRIKRLYNRAPRLGKRAMLAGFLAMLGLRRLLGGPQPLNTRGMTAYHDAIDWLGGLPYEYASPAEIQRFVEPLGFALLSCIPPRTPTGCNEFVFRATQRPSAHGASNDAH
jgi:2-polyprenyl-6-hydroxyphenyl methylase/3-demethylubiquinone-9 3-methyltransferase